MQLRTAYRAMPALLLAIPLWVFVLWYALIEPRLPADGYAVDAAAKATGTLAFIGPFCALTAAWEGSRLRRGQLWKRPTVRSRVHVASLSMLPAVLVGFVGICAAIETGTTRAGAWAPDLRFVAMSALDIVAYAAAGFAAGIVLPLALAGPLAAVGVFAWLAFVPAFEPVWLRHLTGMFRDCCALSEDLAWQAVIASAIADLGFIAAAALIASGLAKRGFAATAALAVSLLVGVALVAGMTYAPVVPRDHGQLACVVHEGTTVCTWPEHAESADEIAAVIAEARSGWLAAGINPPSEFTEASSSITPAGALGFAVRGGSSRDDIIAALASAMIPPDPNCPGGATGGVAVVDLAAWYSAAAGMSSRTLQLQFGGAGFPGYDRPLSVVAHLLAATPQARQDWLARARAIAQACDDWPADQIAVH
ncbi:MAG: hypothetical protein M0Z94_13500 [Dehalococcoidales bacterium]|nr:hypothetical protein [Dehalococcoidales bacterium]